MCNGSLTVLYGSIRFGCHADGVSRLTDGVIGPSDGVFRPCDGVFVIAKRCNVDGVLEMTSFTVSTCFGAAGNEVKSVQCGPTPAAPRLKDSKMPALN